MSSYTHLRDSCLQSGKQVSEVESITRFKQNCLFLTYDHLYHVTVRQLLYIKAVPLFQPARSVTLTWPRSSSKDICTWTTALWLMGTSSLVKLQGARRKQFFPFLNFYVGFWKMRVSKKRSITYIQIPEVLIIVKGISNNKLVWNFKSNNCKESQFTI